VAAGNGHHAKQQHLLHRVAGPAGASGLAGTKESD
jgi:hypothetical protein